MRKILKLVTLALALIGGIGVSGLIVAGYLNSPPPGREKDEEFVVSKGETVNAIAEQLEQRGVIRSKEFLILYSKIRGSDTLYRAGHYLIPIGKTTLEIHDILVTGAEVLQRVTIPEGWTRGRIARHLESKGITTAEEFLKASQDSELLSRYQIPANTFEGYFFPETYHFPREYPALKVVQTMVDTFFDRVPAFIGEEKFSRGRSLHEKVILASIIEREYRDPLEAPLMASVFYNRLRLRIPLGSCATIEYIITELLGRPHPEVLFYVDLEIDSPYNTYKHVGLPPGPISNPGEVALRAAFFPATSEYRFFVLRDPTAGRHHFSRTLEEHNRARFLYLKRIRSGS